MRPSLIRAQKKYMEKKKSEGWRNIRFFIPIEVKPKLLKLKNDLMKEYYARL